MYFEKISISNIMSDGFYLYTFLEDDHSRNKTVDNIRKKEKYNELRDIGSVSTSKELRDKLNSIGSKNQIRSKIRQDKKLDYLYRIKPGIRDKENEIYKKKDKDAKEKIFKVYPKTPEIEKIVSKANNKELNKNLKNQSENRKNAKIDQSVTGGYDPIFRAKYSNKNNPLNKVPIIKKKTDIHEIQHHKDNIYVKNKYGATVAKQIHSQNIKKNAKGKYKEIASEYNAYTVANNIKDINDNNAHDRLKAQTQKVMDDAVHGKKTPKVTDNMIRSQNSILSYF